MPVSPLRFLHAADLHLERLGEAVSDAPAWLRDLLLGAAEQAAQKLFELAEQQVDFVLLAGDVLDPLAADARACFFLVEQFQRLAQQNITVYWAGGTVDAPQRWPTELTLPDNVRLFSHEQATSYVHRRGEQPLARIIGLSRDGQPVRLDDFVADDTVATTIGLVPGQVDPALLESRGLNYWALGGRHRRQTLFHHAQAAHDPGPTQGQSFDEPGAHGATLVEQTVDGRLRLEFLPSDVCRWITATLAVEPDWSLAGLQQRLVQEAAALRDAAGRFTTLVRWELAGSGLALDQLRRSTAADSLLSVLRQGQQQVGGVWSVSLRVSAPHSGPAEEPGTILGDFQRSIRQLRQQNQPIDLSAYFNRQLAVSDRDPPWHVAHGRRDELLREAAALGEGLLGGDGFSEEPRE